jgi:hypothetical protein
MILKLAQRFFRKECLLKTVNFTIKIKDDPIEGDDHLWRVSRDLWSKGSVTSYLEKQITGLKDSNGKPLPDHAKQFLLDILFNRIKLPKKGRRNTYSETAVKQVYKNKLEFIEFEKWFNPENRLRGLSPSQEALTHTSEVFGISESTVSDIIYPKRKKKKSSR